MLPAPVAQALKAAGIPVAATAVVVQQVDAATPSVAVNARVTMNPASTMKLVTTFAALELLGPAYTWKTEALMLVRSSSLLLMPASRCVLLAGCKPKLKPPPVPE